MAPILYFVRHDLRSLLMRGIHLLFKVLDVPEGDDINYLLRDPKALKLIIGAWYGGIHKDLRYLEYII